MDYRKYKETSESFQPNLMVGIEGFILGETERNNPNIIYGLNLPPEEQKKEGWPLATRYFAKSFNKDIFDKRPSLRFDAKTYCLADINIIIKSEYKGLLIENLTEKYGKHEREIWVQKGLYRKEIYNKYGVIQITLGEHERKDKEDNWSEPTIKKELFLNMYFVSLRASKVDLQKSHLEKEKKFREEQRRKSDIKKLFDL